MKTVVIQIGNSDDKLSQSEWSRFVNALTDLVEKCCTHVHFSGHSQGDAPWQNYCVVAESEALAQLRLCLCGLAKEYRQDSIALTVGNTIFPPHADVYDGCFAFKADSPTAASVQQFAKVMEQKLSENRHKGDRQGWLECSPEWLFSRLVEEVGEVAAIMRGSEGVGQYADCKLERELADVANFCMMLADRVRWHGPQEAAGSDILRWNFEADDDGLIVCREQHEKHESCEAHSERVTPHEALTIIRVLRHECRKLAGKAKASQVEVDAVRALQSECRKLAVKAGAPPPEVDASSIFGLLFPERVAQMLGKLVDDCSPEGPGKAE